MKKLSICRGLLIMLLKRYRTPKRTYRNKGYIGYNTQNENK